MGHKIVEAIIENGQLKYVDQKLPDGKIKVHLIYAVEQAILTKNEIEKIVMETSGIYRDIDVDAESRKLREQWERDVRN